MSHINPAHVTLTGPDGQTVALVSVIADLQAKLDTYYADNFKVLTEGGRYMTVEAEVGRKFIRMINKGKNYRSCWFFLDFNGNILKSDGWKKPAKHIRGSIFSNNFWGAALGPYGAAYL